ncbi:MAG: GtrA family protein [Rhizobiaceae bacterium]
MTLLPATAGARADRRHHLSPALVAAMLATAIVLAMEAARGFPGVANFGGDNDSLLRMVEIRDLLAGQDWFDLTQYRLGLDGGTAMHWSRLIDAPIAALILLVAWLTGSVSVGEGVAAAVWPALTYAVSLYFLVRAAERLGGEQAVLPAAVIGGICLYSIAIFQPGMIDHHNVQFALTVATISLLLDAEDRAARALPAGITAGLSIAIGMETAPSIASIGAAVGLLYLVRGGRSGKVAASFGVGFAATGLAVLVLTLPAAHWRMEACDAFSAVQFWVMVIGGLGLAASTIPAALNETMARRAVGLGCVALAIVAVLAVFFPQCLAAPLSDLDPRQKIYWLDSIHEAQSAWSALMLEPVPAMGRLATPLLALTVMVVAAYRRGASAAGVLVGIPLLASVMVTAWQIRGGAFAAGLAVIPLAAWVGAWRAEASSGVPAQLKMVAAWLLSINLVWSGFAQAFVAAGKPAEAAASENECLRASDYALLNTLPAATVLSGINQGSSILAFTRHRALAGPYHRNVGNIAAYEAISSEPERARKILIDSGVSLIAVCRAFDENPGLAPDTLHARVTRGDSPTWLQIVPASKGQPIEIYTVVPTAG